MVLGWHITIKRESSDSELGRWQSSPGGIDWLEDLVSSRRATRKGDGYPLRYRVRVADVLQTLESGPPAMRIFWKKDPEDVITGTDWGVSVLDLEQLAAMEPGDWLIFEV